jgi:hypothetical protein
MDLDRHYEEFSDALLSAYDMNALTMMLQFDMQVRFNDIVGPGPGANRVFELIGWCDQKGRVDELFLKALKRNPGNLKLRTLANKLAVEVQGQHKQVEQTIRDRNLEFDTLESDDADMIRELTSAVAGNDGLQAIVVAAKHLGSGQELEIWDQNNAIARRRVCSVAINGSHNGTGFLVGPDLIITNSHVVVESNIASADVAFDYVGDTERDQLATYSIKEELIRSQPKDLDFVLFRLKESPEGNRGFFDLTPYEFDKVRDPIHILGHPNGKSMRFSYGVVFDNNSYIKRLAYTANTEPGSSGSPVFLENWDLAAIHHHGEPNVNNHGIPMKWILKFMNDQGKGDVLKPKPPE